MISQLCKEIEHALKRHIATPKDFEFLRSRIFARHHIYLSTTTLMRIWGYVNENVEPRRSTLNILSQFLGYSSWEDFQYNASLPQELQSSPVLNRRLSVEKSLRHGDRLRLIWLPDRVCDIEYLGNRSFRVWHQRIRVCMRATHLIVALLLMANRCMWIILYRAIVRQ